MAKVPTMEVQRDGTGRVLINIKDLAKFEANGFTACEMQPEQDGEVTPTPDPEANGPDSDLGGAIDPATLVAGEGDEAGGYDAGGPMMDANGNTDFDAAGAAPE